jgi:broad specificity phosphatase PhoE
MERFGGTMEGIVVNDWGDFNKDGSAESDASILNRAKQFLETIKQTNYNCVLVVSHNGLLKNLRHLILEKDGEVDFRDGGLSNCDFESFEI